MSTQETIFNCKEEKAFFYNDKCDINDYLIAAACGAIAGIVDIMFVGAPYDNKFQAWTDKQVDRAVMSFARKCGWKPKQGKENNVASAIGDLERKFKVNYDQRHKKDVLDAFKMSTTNHHMKSLSHAPDILGLFFSILNQMTSTSTFLSDGKLYTIKTNAVEMSGNNFIEKCYAGIVNWVGHIMSDVAGSSGGRGNRDGRGSGIVIPFYELFQTCDFGKFQVEKNKNSLAQIAIKVFQEGYDFRFGITMAIPVILCELTIRLFWALKQCFYYKKSIEECIPTKRHDDLRVMLMLGNGVLCIMDGTEAWMKSGGNWVKFFLRLNIIAWYRFTFLVLREVCIRLEISFPLQRQLDAYIRINEALEIYLLKLKSIDIDLFEEETRRYNEIALMLEKVESEKELNRVLKGQYEILGLEFPYVGDFDSFMKNPLLNLEFR